MAPPDKQREKFRRNQERTPRSTSLPSRRAGQTRDSARTTPQVLTPMPFEGDPSSTGPGALARLLEAVAKMLSPKPHPQQPAANQPQPVTEPPVFTVVVAAMNGDTADGAASFALFKALESRSTLKVKQLSRPFQLDNLEDPTQVNAAVTNLRHAVAGEDADLMVWGDILRDGYRLRLASTANLDDERSNTFGVSTRIEMPDPIGDTQSALLYAAIMAAAEPVTQVQRAAVRRLLPAAIQPLEAIAARPPTQWDVAQQRSLQLVYGHIAAACAQAVPPSQSAEWFQKAVNAYLAAEKRLGRNDQPWEGGLIRRHLAVTYAAWAERDKERLEDLLTKSAESWRQAAETLTRAAMPQEWAMVQTKLGITLYRLDLKTGNVDLLREALQVLQNALQVQTKTEAPLRWAEVMHNIAQVLEVYGDQLRNPEVLQRAIEACHSVLEIRTRDRTPLAWASTSNTLGSALFLLDKHGEGISHLDEAAQVLAAALEVFNSFGAKGPAQVAARNLAHVQKLAEERRGRQIIDPHWADD